MAVNKAQRILQGEINASQILNQLRQRRIFALLSYGLLILVLATDSLTPLGFAHGTLYSPVLLLSALSGRLRHLNIVLGLSLILVWLGMWLSPAYNFDLQPVYIYANRLFSCFVLLALYCLCRLGMAYQKNQLLQREQLHMSSQLARLGGWQLTNNGQLKLSAEAQQILDIDQSEITLQRFAQLLVDADGQHFLTHMQADKVPLDVEYRHIENNGELRWLRFMAHQDSQQPPQIHGILQDVHATHVAESKLAEEERRFHYVGDSMQLFTWTAKPDGNLDYVSRFTLDYFGASEKFITENWFSFLHPDDQQPTMNRWLQSLKTGEPYGVEFRLRRHDGKYFWYLTRAIAARDEQGKIYKWYGTGIDVSEIKLLQQRREQLSQQLQNTLASITDAFFSLDDELCFSYVNEQAAHLLEQSSSALLNKLCVSDTIIDSDGSFSLQLRRAMSSHSMTAFEFWFASRELWLDVRVYPAAEGLTVYLRDITIERQQQELKLLRSAVSQLNDMVIITEATPLDEPGPKIVFVNAAFERNSGYSRDEAIGHSPRFLQGPKTQRHELDKIRLALLSQQPVRVQLTNYHKDGSEYEIELNIAPIGMESGRVTHLVAIQRDITAEKNLQKQLQLSQRMEAIGQLTGGIAHDFNNLLTVITGNNDILQDALQDQPKLLALSKLISNAAERGAGLTRNLLAFARRQPLSPIQVDVNELIMQLQTLLRSSLSEKYKLRLELNEDLWPVMIDPVQMESSLLNMTINARDAMAEDGQLSIRTENLAGKNILHDIDLSKGDWVKISICDSGNGIADNMIDKIFEPFFTTKGAGKGSGMGLSMVFGFIKQSGGHIRVQSETGKGTCFNLYLPRVTAKTPPPEIPVSASIEANIDKDQQKTILVVEDDELVRQYATAQLRDAGYHILEAADATEALDWLNSEQTIDLLFTDVLMPDSLSGIELAQLASQIRPGLPVLYTSGYTENILKDMSDEQRQQCLLNKPYHRATLLQRIARALKVIRE